MLKDYVDFEIIREPWNEYSLDDGTHVKTRTILTKITKTETGSPSYGMEIQNIIVALNSPENLKGSPDTSTYSQEELADSIVQSIDYKTLSEEWCEYITDDATKIRIKSTVTNISRTNKYDKNGDPILIVQYSSIFQVTPKKYNILR